jgi:hypothetical protein
MVCPLFFAKGDIYRSALSKPEIGVHRVIPAQAGIQIAALVSRLRGTDVTQKPRFDKAVA